MLQVAIVDDEPWIVKGIARSCDWARHGAEVSLQLSDPEEAIRRIITERPDIVLTDINMGTVSGLDLMARIRAAGLHCAFVVISGYDEFAYAQRAMELGATHYLLKPLKREELEAVMGRLAISLGRTQTPGTENDDLEDWLNTRNITSHRMLFSHFHEYVPDSGWQSAVVDGSDAARFREMSLEPLAPTVFLAVGVQRFIVFFNTDVDLYARISALADVQSSPRLAIGLSALHIEDCHPLETWQEADAALCGRFINPGGHVFGWRNQPVKMRGVLERFLQAFERPATILPFLDAIGPYARDNHYGIGDVLWIYNLFCITWNYAGSVGGADRFPVATPQELCGMFRTVDEMGQYLREATLDLLRMHPQSGMPADTRFESLLRHVETHYAEPLYLSDIAEEFHYNVTYVSDLFRKHLNRGFAEHVTMLRVNRAKYLLLETDLPVTEVAAQCGYPDACHFSRQFRKMTGLAPRLFRSDGGRTHEVAGQAKNGPPSVGGRTYDATGEAENGPPSVGGRT